MVETNVYPVHGCKNEAELIEFTNALSKESPSNVPDCFLAEVAARGCLMSLPPAVLFVDVLYIRKLLSVDTHPPIDAVVNAGVVPALVEVLKVKGNNALVFEAAWAVSNVASGTAEHTALVVNNGAVPLFVELLKSEDMNITEQAGWALGNIAGDDARTRDFILANGAAPVASEQYYRIKNDAEKITVLRNFVWMMSNFCRSKPPPLLDTIRPLLPPLLDAVYHPDPEVGCDAMWALSYVTDGPQERHMAVLQQAPTTFLKHARTFLTDVNARMTPALRVFGNLVTGSDTTTEVVLRSGVLEDTASLLRHPKRAIRKETCWMLSNITAGNEKQVLTVFDNSALLTALKQCLRAPEFEVRKEAVWAVANATTGSTHAIDRILQCNLIADIAECLKMHDPKIVVVAMEAFENIFEIGQSFGCGINPYVKASTDICPDLVSVIEALQEHASAEVYNKAVSILGTYFDVDAEGDFNEIAAAPPSHGGAFVF